MRSTLLALCLLTAIPSSAQQARAPNQTPLRLTVFATAHPVGYGSGTEDSAWGGGGVAVALEYRWQGAWGLELSLGAERNEVAFIERGYAMPEYERETVTSYPVDLVAHYHFRTRGSWKPHVGLGARYIPGPDSPYGTLESRFAPQASVGIDYMLTPAFSLRLDATRLLSGRTVGYNPVLKASAGVSWRF